MPITYQRIRGGKRTVTRAQPDERLEKSKRWKRVDLDGPKAKTRTSPAPAGEPKEG
jgi:hypothetical protein